MPRDNKITRNNRVRSIGETVLLSYALLLSEVNCFQPHAAILSLNHCGSWGGPAFSTRSSAVTALLSTSATPSKGWETTPDEDNDSLSRAPAAKTPVGTSGASSSSLGVTSSGKFSMHKEQTAVDTYDMPWFEVQDWALRDNLPKYTIMIPLETSGNEKSALVFALWRTMLKEVPELAGYPLDFLQGICDQQIAKKDSKLQVTPQLLPYLEDYTFATAGGVSGKVYGVPGLADGTRIETSAVTNVEVTLPQGFVRTSDGKAAYELGRPLREAFSETDDLVKQSLSTATAGSMELLKTVKNVGAGVPDAMEDADGMLVRLGISTGILLTGATAINMLSHHLTVNVFWV